MSKRSCKVAVMVEAKARRAPVQERSRARVDAILDAADAVFLEMSYAEATTNHVAARAGTSIGSLYRFFPDKEALLIALAARYRARLVEKLAELRPADPKGLTVASMVANGIEGFNAYLRQNPGFRTLIEQANHPALRAGNREHDDVMARAIFAMHERVSPLPKDARRAKKLVAEREAVAEVTVTVLGQLQMLSLTRDEPFRARVVEEAKLLVTSYLAARLGIDPNAKVT